RGSGERPRLRARKPARTTLFLALVLFFSSTASRGEPYLAARSRARCSSCHVNMTGGGERNAQGRIYAQGTLARHPFDASEGWPLLTGEVAGFLTAGADLRGVYRVVHPTAGGGKETNEFAVEEGNVYLTAKVWRDRLSLHVDERIAPGGAQSR